MGLGAKHLLLNLVSSAAVAGVVAAIGIGLPLADQQIPTARPVSSAHPYLIGGGVAVTPPTGASLDASKTRPGTRTGSVLFLIGSVRYAVAVRPFDGTLREAAARLKTKIEANRGYQVVGAQSSIHTDAGVRGLQGSYSSPGRDGRFTVFLNQGVDAEITAAGSGVDLRRVLPRIRASIKSLTYGNDAQ